MKPVLIFVVSLLLAFTLLIVGSQLLDLSSDGAGSWIYIIGAVLVFLIFSIKLRKDRRP